MALNQNLFEKKKETPIFYFDLNLINPQANLVFWTIPVYLVLCELRRQCCCLKMASHCFNNNDSKCSAIQLQPTLNLLKKPPDFWHCSATFTCLLEMISSIQVHFPKKMDPILMEKKTCFLFRGKSLLESSVTTFLPYWQPPLIFVWFISNFLWMCSNSVDSAHVILK